MILEKLISPRMTTRDDGQERGEEPQRPLLTPSPLHNALFASSSAESLLSVEGTEGAAGSFHTGPIADAVSFVALAAQALMQVSERSMLMDVGE